jgi:Uma2 family endonuclease
LIQPEQKADLIDGVIYMDSPENSDSHRLFRWLYCLLTDYSESRDLGEIFGSRIAFRLGENKGPEPDITFVRKDCLHLDRKGYFDGPPDLAIEIVSPESVQRDYVTKRALYQETGVAEYWIIDEQSRKVVLLRPDRKGQYREVRPKKGMLSSRVLDGFQLSPEWLWQTPRPFSAEVLDRMGPSAM